MLLSWLLLTVTLTRSLHGTSTSGLVHVEDVRKSTQKLSMQHLASKKRRFARLSDKDGSRSLRVNRVDLWSEKPTQSEEEVNWKTSRFPEQKSKEYQDMTKTPKASHPTYVRSTTSNDFSRKLETMMKKESTRHVTRGTPGELETAVSVDDSISGFPSLDSILDKGVKGKKPEFPWTMSQSQTRSRRMANQIMSTTELPVTTTTEAPTNLQELGSLGTSSSTGSSVVDSEFSFRRIQREFCPFTKLCSEPAPKRFPDDHTDVTPCCMPCSCEASCRRKGTCCPDVELQTPENVPATELSKCCQDVELQTPENVTATEPSNCCPDVELQTPENVTATEPSNCCLDGQLQTPENVSATEPSNCCPDVELQTSENVSATEPSNCCTDVELQTSENVSAIKPSNCLPAVYPRDQAGSRVQGYDVVNDCPGGYQNRSVWQRCLGETPEIFLDLVFVTDNETNRIYANRFCAQCHGVSDTILYWGIKEATCNHFDTIYALRYLYETQTAYDLFNTVIELQCSIELEPPAYIEVQSEVCYIHDKLVTNCNETGLWDSYSESVQSRCRSHLAPYMHQTFDETTSRFDTVYYGNLYCYLCNVPSTRAVTPNDTCFLPEYDTGSKQLPPDTAILDLDPLLHIVTKNISNQSNGRCIHVDLTTGDCVLLRCPILTVRHGTDCIEVFVDVVDMKLIQTFNVTFRHSTQIKNDPSIAARAIDKHFLTDSDFAASSCSVYGLAIFFPRNVTSSLPSKCEDVDADCDVFVDVIFQAKQRSCPISWLVRLLYWYLKNEVIAEIDTPEFAVNLTISMTPGILQGGRRYVHVYKTGLQPFSYPFDHILFLNPTFHCRAIATKKNGWDAKYSCTKNMTNTGLVYLGPEPYISSFD